MNFVNLLQRKLAILLVCAVFSFLSVASAAAASLTLVPDGWSSSAQVTINWSATGLASGAWIGVYAVGSADTAYLTSKSISGTSGVVSFGLLANGNYEARLFGDGFYSLKLATAAFTVAAPVGSLSLASAAVKVRESTSVTWQSQPGITSDGWVGVYSSGAGESAYLIDIPIQYVTAGTGGRLTFTAPNTAGSYEFRLFADFGYTVKIATVPFSVAELVGAMVPDKSSYASGNTVTVAWSADAPLPDGAWIGIYSSSTASNSGFVTYKSVTAGSSGSVAFTGLANGSFEARLFRDSGYDRKIGSASFSIGVATTTTSSSSTTSTTSTTTSSTTTTTQQSTATATNARSDCLFNWAESTYSVLFSPRAESLSFGPYYLRYYSQTNAYLAVTANTLVYLGPLSNNQIVELGAVATWYSSAGCN